MVCRGACRDLCELGQRVLRPHDFTFRNRVLEFAAGGYELRCVLTPATRRDTRREHTTEEVESFDHTPPWFDVHIIQMTHIGELDCTLETPDQRTFHGAGEYEKHFEEERFNAVTPTPHPTISPVPQPTVTASGGCSPSPHFSACHIASSQEQCVAAGGVWQRDGLQNNFHCFCETGQGACACRSSGECLGSCVADGVEGDACTAVTTGHCAPEAPFFGCICTVDSEHSGVICTD